VSAVRFASKQDDIAIACSDQGYPQPGMSIKEVFTRPWPTASAC
jgi:hypothetical protein